ncbi:hypothetical protein ACUVXQ_004769, partial [Salmonella enterica subsp. enterica serovar Kentucky]
FRDRQRLALSPQSDNQFVIHLFLSLATPVALVWLVIWQASAYPEKTWAETDRVCDYFYSGTSCSHYIHFVTDI